MKPLKSAITFSCLVTIFGLGLYSTFLYRNNNFLSATPKSNSITEFWFLSLIVSGVLILILSLVWKKNKGSTIEKVNAFTYSEMALLIIVLTGAFFLRLYKIGDHGIFADERYWIIEAKNILNGSVVSPFGFIGDQPSNLPAYVVSIFWFLTNNIYLSVRLPGVLYSLLNILFIYLFSREVLGKKAAFISALVLATSIWDTHMVQLGWNNVSINPFLISGVMLFLYRGIKYQSVIDISLAAFFSGISLNLLYIASLSLVPTTIYFFYKFVISKQRRTLVFLFVVFLLTTWIVSGPTFVKIFKYPTLSIGRHKSFLEQNIERASGYESAGSYYFRQLRKEFSALTKSNTSNFNIQGLWGAYFDRLVVLFFILGLIWCLRFFYKDGINFILLNFSVMFIPVVILYRFSSIWREYGFLPSITVLSAIGYALISEKVKKLSRHFKPIIFGKFIYAAFNFLIVGTYLTSFTSAFKYYDNSQFIHPIDNYESMCRKITDHIDTNISKGALLILPLSSCQSLISATLDEKYIYKEYQHLNDLNLNQSNNEEKTTILVNTGLEPVTEDILAEVRNFELKIDQHFQKYTFYDQRRVSYASLYSY